MTNNNYGNIFYKSVRYINGKLRLIIEDENGNIIKNPTRDQIEKAINEDKSHIKICKYKDIDCCKCGSDKSYMKTPDDPLWYNCKCGKDDCTGYFCDSCYTKTRSPAGWRYGQLDPLSPPGKGFIGAQVVAKRYKLEDCNIKMNSFNFFVDISKHSEYGYIEVKTATLNKMSMEWYASKFHEKNFDNLLVLCMDSNNPWKDVLMAIMIPWEAAIRRTSIKICKNSTRKPWYYDYTIDEKPFNDIFHNMKLDNCKVLRKGK